MASGVVLPTALSGGTLAYRLDHIVNPAGSHEWFYSDDLDRVRKVAEKFLVEKKDFEQQEKRMKEDADKANSVCEALHLFPEKFADAS